MSETAIAQLQKQLSYRSSDGRDWCDACNCEEPLPNHTDDCPFTALRAEKPSEPDGGRAETGPVRFGDDWAGVFIRGDEAFSRALQMDAVAEHYEGLADGDFSGKGMLAINIQGFADLLRSCTEPCEARAIHLAAEEDE